MDVLEFCQFQWEFSDFVNSDGSSEILSTPMGVLKFCRRVESSTNPWKVDSREGTDKFRAVGYQSFRYNLQTGADPFKSQLASDFKLFDLLI